MDTSPGVGLIIKQIHSRLRAEASRYFADIDLTPAQGHFLILLHRSDQETARMKEMESHFHCSQPTIAGIASRLEKKGLISSFIDPKDRRIKCVRLTDAGRALCEGSRDSIHKAEAKMLNRLSDEEQETLFRLLHLCCGALSEP